MTKLSYVGVMLAVAAVPATAQPVAPAAKPAAPAAAIDPARLALARTTVASVWPLGTYQKMMSNLMMDQMMGAMFDTKLGDLVPEKDLSDADKKMAGTTMREAIASKDPHFEERMRLTNKVMMSEMGTIFAKIEPAIQEGLAKAYAKKFSAEQLGDLNRFFATPTGKVYATESLLLFMDPEMMKAMIGMVPELMKSMPAIMMKVKDATAHLPEPPTRGGDAEDQLTES